MNYYPILFSQSGRAINLLTLLFSSSGHLRQNIHVSKNVKAIDCAGRWRCARRAERCAGRGILAQPLFGLNQGTGVLSTAKEGRWMLQQVFVVETPTIPHSVRKKEHCKYWEGSPAY